MNLKQGDLGQGDRVRIVGNGATKGKTGTIVRLNKGFDSVLEHIVEFDSPMSSGKRVQSYGNVNSLQKLDDQRNVCKRLKKKTAVFINQDDEIFLIDDFESLDEALKEAEEETDGDPDFCPKEVVWEGIKYKIRAEMKLIAE